MPFGDELLRGSLPTYSAISGVHPLMPEEVATRVAQGTAEKSAALSMFPTQKMSRSQFRMPVLDALPSAYWVTEGGLKQSTTVTWRNVFLYAEEIAVLVPVSIPTFEDADWDLWDEIKPRLEEAIAKTLDEAVFFGLNAPSTWPTAVSTAAIAAGNTVTAGAGVDIAADLNTAMGTVEVDGFDPNGIAMRSSLVSTFRGLREATTNALIFNAPINQGVEVASFKGNIWGLRTSVWKTGAFEAHDTAAANASQLIVGDWSQGRIGIRQDIRYEMFKEGIISDDTGTIIYNLMQQDMMALRVTCRYGYAVPNPTNRLQPTTASRYPFAVIRMAA